MRGKKHARQWPHVNKTLCQKTAKPQENKQLGLLNIKLVLGGKWLGPTVLTFISEGHVDLAIKKMML